MQPGDSWSVPAGEPDLTLTTGNAGGLEVSDNGVSLGGFGRGGAVRHNIPLTEAGVKAAVSGQPAAAQTTTPAAAPQPVTPVAPGPTVSDPTPAPAAVHHVHRPRPAPVNADLSADDLNARQLDRHPQH
jgi:hypothetical protein